MPDSDPSELWNMSPDEIVAYMRDNVSRSARIEWARAVLKARVEPGQPGAPGVEHRHG